MWGWEQEVCIHAYGCAPLCVHAEDANCPILSLSALFPLGISLSWAGSQLAPAILLSPSHPCSTGVTSTGWNPNSSPHSNRPSMLPTELSPRPRTMKTYWTMEPSLHHSSPSISFSVSPYRPEVGRALTEAWACFILIPTASEQVIESELAPEPRELSKSIWVSLLPIYHQIQTRELGHLKCSYESQRNHLFYWSPVSEGVSKWAEALWFWYREQGDPSPN